MEKKDGYITDIFLHLTRISYQRALMGDLFLFVRNPCAAWPGSRAPMPSAGKEGGPRRCGDQKEYTTCPQSQSAADALPVRATKGPEKKWP